MSMRLWVWWLWRRLRLALVGWRGPSGRSDAPAGPSADADPLGAMKQELLRSVERLDVDAQLEIPSPGEGYEPIELTPALEARRDRALAELVEHQGRSRLRRSRVRRAKMRARVATVGAATALLLVVTAGSSALGLGVPLLDQVLDTIVSKQEAANGPSGDHPIPGLSLRPGTGGRTEPIEFPLPSFGGKAEAVAYAARDGGVCSALALPPGASGAEPGAGINCSGRRLVAESLVRDPVLATVTQALDDRAIVVEGFAAADVVEIATHPLAGVTATYLSEPATLTGGESLALRLFVVVIRPTATGGSFSQADLDRALDHRGYGFTVTHDDGRTTEVIPRS